MPVRRLAPPEDWPTLGWVAIDWIEHYLCHGPGDVQGEPLFLDDEFAKITLDLYRIYPQGHERAGRRVVTYGAVSEPKGRAKSEYAGAIACLEALGPCRFDGWDADGDPVGRPVTSPVVRVLATEEGQTGNTYGNVLTMLEHARERFGSEWRFDKLDLGSTRTLIGGGGEIRPCTAGAASKDGGKETFAVADEVHLYVLPELRQMHAMVRRNSRKRKIAEPWMLATTTMFEPGAQSVAEELFDEAEKLEQLDRKHYGFFFHHREGLPLDDDAWESDAAQVESLTEAYGPAAEWMDLESIVLDEIRAPGSVKAESVRYFHNLKFVGENHAVDLAQWDQLAAPERNPTGGERVLLAFDGSDGGAHADDTALLLIVPGERPHVVFVDRWRRPKHRARDWRVPRPEVRAKVTEIVDTYQVVRFPADPPGWRQEIEAWDAVLGDDEWGDPIAMEWATNRPSLMGPAIDRFLERLAEGSFTHDGSPELREYAGNALLTKAKGQGDFRALAKPSVDRKIDGLVVTVMGLHEADLWWADDRHRAEKVVPWVAFL